MVTGPYVLHFGRGIGFEPFAEFGSDFARLLLDDVPFSLHWNRHRWELFGGCWLFALCEIKWMKSQVAGNCSLRKPFIF